MIGESLSEPHTSERFHTVNHSRSKTENYKNSKYRLYSEPCHEVCARKYHAISKYCLYGEPRHVRNILPILNMDHAVYGVCTRKYKACPSML